MPVAENLRFLNPGPSAWSWSCSNGGGEDGGEDGGEKGGEEGREEGRGEDDIVDVSPALLALLLKSL